MDKKEAIEILNQHKKITCHDCMHPQQVGYCEEHCKLSQAFDIAIEALKYEECKDAISRKGLAEALDTYPKYGVDERGRIVNWHEGLVPYVKCLDVFMVLSNSPSVMPKRPTGHWIEERDCEGKKRWLTCSVCGYKTDDYYFNNPNYCQNCGADLRGKQDG